MAQDDSVREAAMSRRVARAEIAEGGMLGKFTDRLHPRDRSGKWRKSGLSGFEVRSRRDSLGSHDIRHEGGEFHGVHVPAKGGSPDRQHKAQITDAKTGTKAEAYGHSPEDAIQKATAKVTNQNYENARGSSPSDLSGLSGDALKRARERLEARPPADRPINHSADVKDGDGEVIGRAIQGRKGSKGWLAHHHEQGNVGEFAGKVEAENAVRAAHKSGKPQKPEAELEADKAKAREHEGFAPLTPHQRRVSKRIKAEKGSK